MHCPRCGQESSRGDRFCVNCGAELPSADTPAQQTQKAARPSRPRSAREWPPYLRARATELIGTTRRARLATLGTVLAVAVGVAAFLALAAEDEEPAAPPRDAYTSSSEEACVAAAAGIAAASQEAGGASSGPRAYARRIVPPVAVWRSTFIDTLPPADRAALATSLDAALLQSLIEAGSLARLPAKASEAEIAATAARLDSAGAAVEEAAAALGLEGCEGPKPGTAQGA